MVSNPNKTKSTFIQNKFNKTLPKGYLIEAPSSILIFNI